MMNETFPLLLSVFRHADASHLAGNLAALIAFGPRLVRAIGSWRCALLFLSSGVAANAIAARLIGRPVIGASGAVSALVAAHFLLLPRARIAGMACALPILLWIALQFFVAGVGLDLAGIAWPAHLAGIGFGALAAFLMESK
jgi:membrane associated rhomboid family serine protease